MNLRHKSIFNLIEIFRSNKRKQFHAISPKTHCEQKQIHDYYCDSEKPYVSSLS